MLIKIFIEFETTRCSNRIVWFLLHQKFPYWILQLLIYFTQNFVLYVHNLTLKLSILGWLNKKMNQHLNILPFCKRRRYILVSANSILKLLCSKLRSISTIEPQNTFLYFECKVIFSTYGIKYLFYIKKEDMHHAENKA